MRIVGTLGSHREGTAQGWAGEGVHVVGVLGSYREGHARHVIDMLRLRRYKLEALLFAAGLLSFRKAWL